MLEQYGSSVHCLYLLLCLCRQTRNSKTKSSIGEAVFFLDQVLMDMVHKDPGLDLVRCSKDSVILVKIPVWISKDAMIFQRFYLIVIDAEDKLCFQGIYKDLGDRVRAECLVEQEIHEWGREDMVS